MVLKKKNPKEPYSIIVVPEGCFERYRHPKGFMLQLSWCIRQSMSNQRLTSVINENFCSFTDQISLS